VFVDELQGSAMREATAITLLLLAVGAGLAGCGGPAQLSVAHHSEDPWPNRKAGLWAQTLIRDGHAGRGHAALICLDGGPITDVATLGHRLGARDCDRSVVRDGDGAYHFVSACSLGSGATVTTKGVASGDFTSHYQIDADMGVDGAPIAALDGHHQLKLVGQYRGPCPTGAAPGAVVSLDGQKLGPGRRVGLLTGA
jgi:hypothetical protein